MLHVRAYSRSGAIFPLRFRRADFRLRRAALVRALVSKPVAALVGINPDAEGNQRADFAVLGNIRATSDDAFPPDMIMDGKLEMPFLRDWAVTLDLKQGLAWLGKPAGPPAAA
ncbi:MAG: hypothetical protein V4808_01140 [Pseudomonadota bacterium]